MKDNKDEKPQPPIEELELVVTEEDYQEGLKRGWTDDDMLKPGRYKFRRGGFLDRHPELKDKMGKRADGAAQGAAEELKTEVEAFDGRAS